METIEKKPINEYKLAVTSTHTKKGVKGFIRVEKPKTELIQLRVNSEVKAFIEEYCSINQITGTSLLLASLECYTFFDGTNAKAILQRAKQEMKKPRLTVPTLPNNNGFNTRTRKR